MRESADFGKGLVCDYSLGVLSFTTHRCYVLYRMLESLQVQVDVGQTAHDI